MTLSYGSGGPVGRCVDGLVFDGGELAESSLAPASTAWGVRLVAPRVGSDVGESCDEGKAEDADPKGEGEADGFGSDRHGEHREGNEVAEVG